MDSIQIVFLKSSYDGSYIPFSPYKSKRFSEGIFNMRIGARSALKIQFQIVGIINSLRYSAKKNKLKRYSSELCWYCQSDIGKHWQRVNCMWHHMIYMHTVCIPEVRNRVIQNQFRLKSIFDTASRPYAILNCQFRNQNVCIIPIL